MWQAAAAHLASIADDLTKGGAPILERVLRGLLVYLFLLIAIRLFGRRQLSQLTAFDLIVLLTLSNILQNAMIGRDDTLVGGLAGALTLLAANSVVALVAYRSRWFERLIDGRPQFLVRDGQIQSKALRRELLTEQDLLSAVRRVGLERIDQVKLAISEPNGEISVIPKTGEGGLPGPPADTAEG
jgi:uncharacterized membrane protein YcaP (DUF421 family)